MVQHISSEIAIIGAGVVGLAIAEALVAEGLEVILVDPEAPGSGASYGNAGTIADYAVLPRPAATGGRSGSAMASATATPRGGSPAANCG